MNKLFLRILNVYLGKIRTTEQGFSLANEYYNHLPMIFRVKAHNDLDLSKDYETQKIILPARANARNMKLAERMRRYATYRVTK